MADPSRRLMQPAASSSSGVAAPLVLGLCVLCLVLGAMLALAVRRCACARGFRRKRWGLKLEDAAALPPELPMQPPSQAGP